MEGDALAPPHRSAPGPPESTILVDLASAAYGAWFAGPVPKPAVPIPLRSPLRTLRKRGKRVISHVQLASMVLRNRVGRGAVVGHGDVVVSLTTHGARLSSVAFTIESIARGSSRPRRLILWLDDPAAFASLPDSLRRLQCRGLDVRLTENYGPHTKYFPALETALADQLPMVTADDDIIYPRRWLSTLLTAGREHGDAVNCYRAYVVKVAEGALAPYATWPMCRTSEPSPSHFATGVAGVWYPIPMLQQLSSQGSEFMRWCPRADDIWLHWTALRAGIAIRQVSRTPQHFPYIPGTQIDTLMSVNVQNGDNDVRIAELYDQSDVLLLTAA